MASWTQAPAIKGSSIEVMAAGCETPLLWRSCNCPLISYSEKEARASKNNTSPRASEIR
jgi:hypothetical protein